MIKINKLMILVGLIALTIVGGMVMNFFDKRPFKFEVFKTDESLKIFLEKTYPIGSDGDIALKELELAGAKCHLVLDRSQLPNGFEEYDYIGWCDYLTPWLSWPPKEHYQVIIMGNKNKKIKKFSVSKYSGFMI